jgi:hypothetical protein
VQQQNLAFRNACCVAGPCSETILRTFHELQAYVVATLRVVRAHDSQAQVLAAVAREQCARCKPRQASRHATFHEEKNIMYISAVLASLRALKKFIFVENTSVQEGSKTLVSGSRVTRHVA